jgi:hypothetical protein
MAFKAIARNVHCIQAEDVDLVLPNHIQEIDDSLAD